MLLSIIVPSFNQGRFIGRTLESILSQDYRPIEIIVADGASSDGTLDILRAYAARHPELRWHSERDGGPADAVNKGLAQMRGEVAAVQSSDDVYLPGAFTTVMRLFREDPTCGFLVGDYRGIGTDDRELFTARLPDFSWEAYFGMALCIPQSSIFFRTDVARAAGFWNGAYFGCDLDYWLRLMLRTKARHIAAALSGWRMYAGARTHSGQQARIWDGYWRMIDDCRELRDAPARVRRLARASRHIMALSHHPTGNIWALRAHALAALLQHPTFWRYQPADTLHRLIPGYRRLARLARRVSGGIA
jgi:hypothetical protein